MHRICCGLLRGRLVSVQIRCGGLRLAPLLSLFRNPDSLAKSQTPCKCLLFPRCLGKSSPPVTYPRPTLNLPKTYPTHTRDCGKLQQSGTAPQWLSVRIRSASLSAATPNGPRLRLVRGTHGGGLGPYSVRVLLATVAGLVYLNRSPRFKQK